MHMKNIFPYNNKPSLLQRKKEMFQSFFVLQLQCLLDLFYAILHARAFGIVDAYHCRCKWLALLRSVSMDSPTSSPKSFLSLLMDNQGAASSSIPISIVLGHLVLQKNVGKLWTNPQFLFLLDICEKKIWEYNWKLFNEANWKKIIKQLNAHFP